MYLKIHFYDRLLKFVFKDGFKTYDGLATFIEEKTGISRDQLKIVFTDLEGDLMNITSNDDIEFFLDQKRNEEYKEIIVSRVRDSEFNQHRSGSRIIRKVSADVEKLRKSPANVFRDHSINHAMDWSFSTIKRHNEFEDRGDDTELKSLGFSHASVKKKGVNDESVRALEGCFTQLMSQVCEMKMTYESKISALEGKQNALVQNLTTCENTVMQLKDENAALKTEVNTLNKDVADLKSQDDRLTIQTRSYGVGTMLSSGVLSVNNQCRNQQIVEPHRIQRQPSEAHYLSLIQQLVCKMCDMKPIVGKRYICLECKAYNTCESCAMSKYHEHPLRLVINSFCKSGSNDEISPNFLRRKSSEPVSLQQTLTDIKEQPNFGKEKTNTGLQQMYGNYNQKLAGETPPRTINEQMVNPAVGFKSIKNFIIAHVEQDRKEYEKRKHVLDVSFGDTLNDQQKDNIIKKDLAFSFEGFTERLKELQNNENKRF